MATMKPLPTTEELLQIVCALLASGHYTERIEDPEGLEVPVLTLKGEELACIVDAISLWRAAKERLSGSAWEKA